MSGRRLSQLLGQTLRQTPLVNFAQSAIVGIVVDVLSPMAVAVIRDVVGLVSVVEVMVLNLLPGS